MRRYLISYGEIFLKSEKVRRKMIKILLENLRKKVQILKFLDDRGKIYLETLEDAKEILFYTPGIESFSEVVRIRDFNEILDLIKEKVKGIRTFAVRVNRARKDIEKTSKEIEAEIGSMILERYPELRVDLTNPDLTVFVDIRKIGTFVYFERFYGMGGLPIGSEGKGIVLFSGGTDSVLSSVFAMKRGVKNYLLFGDMGEFWSEKALERVRKSFGFLKKIDPEIELWKFNLEELHKEVEIESKLRCILCKALIYKAGEILCKRLNCKGIFTGESIGQVASQTFDNLFYLSKIVEDIPIYRPLAGLNKEEIKEFARRYGFLEITNLDVGRCKLKPRYPETRLKERDFEKVREIVRYMEGKIKFEKEYP